VSEGESRTNEGSSAALAAPLWGRHDVAALLVWTAALVIFFWDAVTLRGALFYFDITEINYPYRAFFADELRAGRFSRWCPGLYCGMPLFSESQAGYLHPFKYLLYPWLATWQAFNLDTILSIWLTGLGTYLWLRRHVGAAGALTGAAVFGLSGFVWAHLIHTSMINALASVPFVVWGLESSWSSGRWRGAVIGGLALACQVFAGHLQDALLTIGLVGLYALYRAATEPRLFARFRALAGAIVLVAVGVTVSAVQWIPSKELLDRSDRAGGLSWDELTYASWHPELLPTLVVREAYGTRARDSDWMHGFYPYHEMDVYMGLAAMGLAVIGAGVKGGGDRWANFWVLLLGAGGILMLGRFTFLFDYANRIPILGSGREPVRFHLWVSLAVAALAALGVERLGSTGAVSLRGPLILALLLIALSIPIMAYLYAPVWNPPRKWATPYHLARYRWLGHQLLTAGARTAIIAAAAWLLATLTVRACQPGRRAALAALLPLLVIVDLLGAHRFDVPTVDPAYWTKAPESVRLLKADPRLIRIFGRGDKHAGEPGYASESLDFLPVRDPLDWSLPLVWGVRASKGNTPIVSRRYLEFVRATEKHPWRHDLESDSHIVTGRKLTHHFDELPTTSAGAAFIHENARALPRARLAGRPYYAADEQSAFQTLHRLGRRLRDRLVVEDPSHPLSSDAAVAGTAAIVEDLPERVVVTVDAGAPAYLVLTDTFDPGWSATLDGRSAAIRPAYVAFRAVYVPEGKHTVVFTYRPAGFELGLAVTGCGIVLALFCWFLRWHLGDLAPEHSSLGWPRTWRRWFLVLLAAIVLVSVVDIDPSGRLTIHRRWRNSIHTHTWGSGIEAMRETRQ
jgi:Bacterial membrane protein YfhO